MRLFELLRTDHNEAKDLLERICATEDGGERGELFKDFKSKLLAHAHAEQRVLYEAMKQFKDQEMTALEATVEHGVAEHLIDQLFRSRSKASNEWLARVTVLKELLEHHIEDEEAELFPEAKRVFQQSELDEMADRFERAKERQLKAA
jgi:hemerythrin superfamily protein